EIFGKREQGVGHARLHGQERQGCNDAVGFSQPRGQEPHKVLMDFRVRLRKALESRPAEEAKLAVGQGMDRCRPWQPVDHGEIADRRPGSNKRDYALSPWRRYQPDLEQAFVEPIAPVAVIAGLEKRVAGLELMERGAGKELRRYLGGH